MNSENASKLISAHFVEWQRLTEQVATQLARALKTQLSTFEPIAKMLETQREEFNRAMQTVIGGQARMAASMASPDFLGTASALEASMRACLAPAFESVRRTLGTLPPRTQRALRTLGSHGWCFDLEMSFSRLWQLEAALVAGNVADSERALCEHYEGRLDSIEKSLVSAHPRRAKILEAAFAAHRRGEYALSIPVFLAQADGICEEVTCVQLYGRKNGRPLTADFVRRVVSGSLLTALLTPLIDTLPIRLSKKERPAESGELFRHAVMHGESCDYGTRVNGLKAISLLNYIAAVLSRV